MRCPFATGQTELPPGHPMIPGMGIATPRAEAATPRPGNDAASKLLTVAKAVTAPTAPAADAAGPTEDAARLILQAAARGRLVRKVVEGQRAVDGTASSISNFSSLRHMGQGATTTYRLPTLSETLIRQGAPAGVGAHSDVVRNEFELD